MSVTDWSATIRPTCPDCARLRADLAAAEERHTRYLDGIRPLLEKVRQYRHTGEPARSDQHEIGALVRETFGLRATLATAEQKLAAAREALEKIAYSCGSYSDARDAARAALSPAPPAAPCPYDTDGDGNCGRPMCPHCGTPPAAPEPERYACARCGVLRTKAEGGTTFTVCDECWEKEHPMLPPEPPAAEPATERALREMELIEDTGSCSHGVSGAGICADCDGPLDAEPPEEQDGEA